MNVILLRKIFPMVDIIDMYVLLLLNSHINVTPEDLLSASEWQVQNPVSFSLVHTFCNQCKCSQ